MRDKFLVCSTFACSLLLTAALSGCSSNTDATAIKVVQEVYYPTRRQTPPEPVYSRVAWSHLPKPIGSVSSNNTVFLKKSVSYEFKKSNLEQAINAIADNIGFEAIYPPDVAKRPVSMKLDGTPDEALAMLGEKTNTSIEVNQSARKLTVIDKALTPTLPTNDEQTQYIDNNAKSNTNRSNSVIQDDTIIDGNIGKNSATDGEDTK